MDKSDLRKIKENDVVLVIYKGWKKEYGEVVGIFREVNKGSLGNACYVSMDRVAGKLKEEFEGEKVDYKDLTVIECISSEKGWEGNFFFMKLGKPEKFSRAITECLDSGKRSFFIDDITKLFRGKYTDAVKFIHNLISIIRIRGGKIVFVISKEDIRNNFLEDVGMFVDAIVEVGG